MRHAVYCGTRNVYSQMEAAAKSLVANTQVDIVHFLIEDAEFPRPLPDFVKVHDVSGQTWFDRNGPNAKTGWTWMVLMRAALCHVLSDVDVVLSMDVDTICHGDASGVWELPIGDCYYAAVMEQHKSTYGLQYANFGVVLFNLAKLRDGKADECIAVLNRHKFTWPEQDAMNYLCQGRICEMPKKYNDMAFNGYAEEPVITHYAGQRNDSWTSERLPTMFAEMPWEEAISMHALVGRRVGKVMFTSDHDLERAENLRAVYEAYKLPKEFVRDTRNMAYAARKGYAAVVVDTLPRTIHDKGDCKSIVINHGIIGKRYALDEPRGGIDTDAFKQIDAALCPSTKTVGIVAGMFGIPPGKVHALGFPRTDMLIGKKKGDGGTFMARYKRAYLYVPTYRDFGHLPRIDWARMDALLEDDEIVVVKRHYFQREPIVTQDVMHIAEVLRTEATAPYLLDCDVVLSDYSAIIADAYIAGKPAVLTTDDMGEYLAKRGMYLDYPSQYCSRTLVAEGHEEELIAMLREAAENGMGDVERAFADTCADMCDGHAAERVCKLVMDMLQ